MAARSVQLHVVPARPGTEVDPRSPGALTTSNIVALSIGSAGRRTRRLQWTGESMKTTRMAVRLSFGLGVLSVAAVGISHLALTDISHGAGGMAEWRALQVSFAIIMAFQLSALTTLGRIMRTDRRWTV